MTSPAKDGYKASDVIPDSYTAPTTSSPNDFGDDDDGELPKGVKGVIYEVYTCDFCLKYYPEDHLEQCDNCGEIFCWKCVPEKILSPCEKYVRAKHYFCSAVCRVEHDVCYVERCNKHHTVRGYTPYLSSEVRRDASDQSVWRWRAPICE
jgi:hypothetical protein